MRILRIVCLLSNAIGCLGVNYCESTLGGTCINAHYNSCLAGYTAYLSYCGFQEMCCVPPIHQNPLPPLAQGQCGVIYPDASAAAPAEHRIVGGVLSLRGEFPWQVSLRSSSANGQHSCGGILIGNKWILTAGHCFETNKNPFAWNGILGEYDRGTVDGHEKLVKVDTLIVHSGFDSNYGNDIAMLRIATENVPIYSQYIRPACLPEKTDSFVHRTCTVTGWGASHDGGFGTRYLYKANVPILSNEVCSYLLDRTIPSGEICAGEKMGGVDSCQGDSGGPMVCQEDGGVWKVAGIVSWGYGCAAHFTPGVYTNVAFYREWIDTVMQYYTQDPPQKRHDGGEDDWQSRVHYV